VEVLDEIGVGEPSVTYSEPGGSYFFVTKISVSGGPGR